ncbi:MAG: ATP-binding protein [Deltaproteobacteria bacterium]|nr:ATP-binding protein [Deltaproteobacteria bacterium]
MDKIPHFALSEAFLRLAKIYSVSILVGLIAVPLAFSFGAVYLVGALLLSAASIWSTRRLEQEAEICSRRAVILERQLDDCRQLSSVDQLSAGIAHEINNPLAIMSQEIQWIQHLFESSTMGDTKEVEDCKESLGIISLQVDRCRETVQKLLSLARHMEPVLQNVDVNKLIENIINILERDAASRNIMIVRNLEENLPVLQGDPPLLRQVMLNLLVNASQALDSTGTITISTSSQDHFVNIVVEDTGCGIPEENLAKIFIPFFSTKPQGKGTGLGLAICRGMVEVMGGHISVCSEVGKSTAFTVSLPIHRRQ